MFNFKVQNQLIIFSVVTNIHVGPLVYWFNATSTEFWRRILSNQRFKSWSIRTSSYFTIYQFSALIRPKGSKTVWKKYKDKWIYEKTVLYVNIYDWNNIDAYFGLLRSRWMILWSCKYLTPEAICFVHSTNLTGGTRSLPSRK